MDESTTLILKRLFKRNDCGGIYCKHCPIKKECDILADNPAPKNFIRNNAKRKLDKMRLEEAIAKELKYG